MQQVFTFKIHAQQEAFSVTLFLLMPANKVVQHVEYISR